MDNLRWSIWRYLYGTKLNKIKFGSEIVETVFSKQGKKFNRSFKRNFKRKMKNKILCLSVLDVFWSMYTAWDRIKSNLIKKLQKSFSKGNEFKRSLICKILSEMEDSGYLDQFPFHLFNFFFSPLLHKLHAS